MSENDFEHIPVDKIKTGSFRVRTKFDQDKLEALSNNVKQKGVLYPIVVIQIENGEYELIAGERRLKVSKEAGNKTIPAIIRKNVEYAECLLEMGIENVLREDLSYFERGRWVAKMKTLGYNIAQLERESGIKETTLRRWYSFYDESRKIQSSAEEDLVLNGFPIDSVNRARANLNEEKRMELYKVARSLETRPSKRQLNRTISILKNNPEISVSKAITRAHGTYIDFVLPDVLLQPLKKDAELNNFTLQEMIIKIMRVHYER